MPVATTNRCVNTEREQPVCAASSATVQLRPGSRCNATMARAQTRVAQRLYPTRRVATTAFDPAPDDEGRNDVGQPGQYPRESCPLTAKLPFHRAEHRPNLRIALEQCAHEHDFGHRRDQRLHATEVKLHAGAEDQRIVRRVAGVVTALRLRRHLRRTTRHRVHQRNSLAQRGRLERRDGSTGHVRPRPARRIRAGLANRSTRDARLPRESTLGRSVLRPFYQ